MKNTLDTLKSVLKKTLLVAGLAIGVATAQPAHAQFLYQFVQGTPFTTATTNSPYLATASYTIVTSPIAMTINSTSPWAIMTNTITVVTTNTIPVFIFNAATYGTNYTTNFGNIYITGTNYVYGTASQNPANTNGFVIK